MEHAWDGHPGMANTPMSHLDDLPTRTAPHVGETESREAFRGAFKDPLFIVRSEEAQDYGVDYLVEAIAAASHPTNVRFHAQLKASTKDDNKDGSYSYSVDRTNLNYLLNSPRSIYVFYSRETQQLFYRWAEDVFVEYEKSKPGWHDQASVTVRFADCIDGAALGSIHSSVLETARHERDLRLRMRVQGVCFSGTFTYDPAAGSLRQVTEIVQFLGTRGLSFAAYGHGNIVLELDGRVPDEAHTSASRLAVAYAAYLAARNGTALELLRRCDLSALADDNQRALHGILLASVQRAVGLLTYEDYVSRLRQVEDAYRDAVPSIYARLERIRHDGLKNPSDESCRTADSIAAGLQAKGPGWAAIASQATLVACELKFYLLQRSFQEQVVTYRMTEHLGIADATIEHRAARATLLAHDYKKWLDDFELALRVADGLKLYLVVAEGLYSFSSCMIQDTLISDKLVPRTAELEKGRAERLKRVLERLDAARAHFEAASAADGAARAQMLKVEAHWLLGERDAARAEAEAVATKALELGLPDLRLRAAAVVAGGSPVEPFDSLPTIFDF